MKLLATMKKAGFLLAFLISFFKTDFTQAQYFGRNKPKYKKDVASVLESPHFEIYHYLENDSTARRLAKWHEWWYNRHKSVLMDTFQTKNPIIFYNHHADFQQTTAIESYIEVGTGGVTESLKNRVVMPYMETHAQTSHVIGHEMVHAFQFRMLADIDTLSNASIRNLPLWMVEGMAEYLSLGRQDPHTAMWMRDAVINNRIPTLKQMSLGYEFFPYRYGHAFWAYVAGIWGEEIIKPLFLHTAAVGYEKALEDVLNISEGEFSTRWAEHLKSYYTPFLADTTEMMGREWFNLANAGNLNISPVYSPDARYIAFISEKEGLSIDVYLAETASGRIIRRLSSGLENFHIDDFDYLESVGTFSPDSRHFAFIVYSKGKNRILVVDVRTGRALREIEIPELEAFNDLDWSPNGRYFVISGMREGQSDLYLYDMEGRRLSALTDDHYSDIQPAWSPDGNWIVFASDRGGKNDAERFRFSGFNICLLDVHSYEVSTLGLFPGASNLNPQFSVDGNMVYFLSDADGFRDLYEYSLVRNEVFRLSSFATGISGITEFAPALTVARDNGMIAYSVFRNGKYTIYRADPADFYVTYKNSDGISVDQRASTLPPVHSLPIMRAQNRLDSLYRSSLSFEENEIWPREYKAKFKLDYVGNDGMINIASGRFTSGLAGGVNALFSDILGNHQLFSAVSLNGEIFDVGAQVAYVNRKNPVSWGGIISHIPYQSATSSLFPDTLYVQDNPVGVTNRAIDFLRTFETRVGGFGIYPLSKTHRLEAGASMTRYHFRLDRINNYYHGGFLVAESRERLPSPAGFNLGQVNAAYVGDNSVFGTVGPLKGRRFRFDIEKYFGAANFHSLLADYRHYIRVRPATLAFRGYHYGRYGQDARNNILPPLFLGQPTLVRGFAGSSFNRNKVNLFGDFSLNQLVGNKVLVGNMEVRLPLSGPESLSLIKSSYFPAELALFLDTGLAWDNRGLVNAPPVNGEQEALQRRPIASTGLSLRANLLGFLVVESYYAFPWQRHIGSGVFGLNFIPSW